MIIQPSIPANGAAVDGDVVGAEVVLVRLAPAQEIVQRALDGDRLADSLQDYGAALGELAQLGAQRVAVLLVQRRQVLVPGRGQLQLRADVLSLDAYAQAEAGRRRLERAQGRRALRHRPQHELLPGLLAQAAEDGRDDGILFPAGGDEVHVVAYLRVPGEADRVA